MTASIRAELAAISAALHTTENVEYDVRSYVGVGRLLAVVSDLNAAVEGLAPAAVPEPPERCVECHLTGEEHGQGEDTCDRFRPDRGGSYMFVKDGNCITYADTRYVPEVRVKAAEEAAETHRHTVNAQIQLRREAESRAKAAEDSARNLRLRLTQEWVNGEATEPAGDEDIIRATAVQHASDRQEYEEVRDQLRSRAERAETDHAATSKHLARLTESVTDALGPATALMPLHEAVQSRVGLLREELKKAEGENRGAWVTNDMQATEITSLRSQLATAVRERDKVTQPRREENVLRNEGWMVAVHNDYMQDGLLHTFWLFTRNGVAVKGEGFTDAEALAKVRRAVDALTAQPEGEAETPAEVVNRLGIDVPKWAAEIRSKVAALPVCSCGANAVCAGLNGPPPHAPDCAAFPKMTSRTGTIGTDPEPPREAEPTRLEMEQALSDQRETYLHGTVRRCAHCDSPVFGGPTACVPCVTAESALTAERDAHGETRRGRDEAQAEARHIRKGYHSAHDRLTAVSSELSVAQARVEYVTGRFEAVHEDEKQLLVGGTVECLRCGLEWAMDDEERHVADCLVAPLTAASGAKGGA